MNTNLPLRNSQASAPTFDRFYLFSFAWAVASVLHGLSFPERLSWQQPWAVATVLAAALVVLAPQKSGFFLLLVVCSLSNTFTWMPYAPNHITFEFLVNGGILLAFGWAWGRAYYRGARWPAISTGLRPDWYAAFAPVVRLSLCGLYFWAVFHKLNRDYFNLDISCSTYLLQGYGERVPLLPAHLTWAQGLSVWGTLVVEAAIPVLLCLRKTRWMGILLGFGFHFFLALHPHPGLYSFSGLLFALYLLFVPAGFPAQLQALGQSILGRRRVALLTAGRVIICAGVLGIVGLALRGTISPGFLIWLAWGSLLPLTYVLVITRYPIRAESPAALLRVRPVALWCIPALVFLNGLTPYLGLKTQTSFSMFSNLRVEGDHSNHLLLPVAMQLTPWAKDLVEIVDTDLAALQPFVTNNQVITYFELRRIASEAAAATDFRVQYRRQSDLQTVQVVNGQSTHPELTKPHGWLAAKFIRFRPVDKGPCLCKH